MKNLADYITNAPDELVMQCIAITRAALDTDDNELRETLLYAAFDKQIALAKTLCALDDNDISDVKRIHKKVRSTKSVNN